MRCLIVEDEYTSRMQLKTFLEEFGTCEFAANGADAVMAFRKRISMKKKFDLICLDIRLPDKSGNDILREIRKLEEDMKTPFKNLVKIFMTTAIANPNCVHEAIHGLCNEYLIKPIERENLIDKLKKHGLVS